MILTVLKEEVPSEQQSRVWAFAAGALAYSALLLAGCGESEKIRPLTSPVGPVPDNAAPIEIGLAGARVEAKAARRAHGTCRPRPSGSRIA